MNSNIKNKYVKTIFDNNQIIINNIESALKNILLNQEIIFKNYFNDVYDHLELENAKKIYEENNKLNHIGLNIFKNKKTYNINFSFKINDDISLEYSLDKKKNIRFKKMEISKKIKNVIKKPIFIKAILKAEHEAIYEIRDYNECNRVLMSDSKYSYSTYEPSLYLIHGIGLNNSFNALAKEHPDMIMDYILSNNEISKEFLSLKQMEKNIQYKIDFNVINNMRININHISLDMKEKIEEKNIIKRILKFF